MTSIDSLNVFPVHGFNEAWYQQALQDYQKERDEYIAEEIAREEWMSRYGYPIENDAIRDDDDDYFLYPRPEREGLGMNLGVLRSLLDTIGTEGRHPAMAAALYKAGIELPGDWPESLYGPEDTGLSIEDAWYPHLFAAYLQDQHEGLLSATEPDALVLIQGRGRKPYRGYESLTIDTWLNKNKITDKSINRSALGKEVLRLVVDSQPWQESPWPPVEPDTQVLQLDDTDRVYLDSEWTSIDELGFEPGEYNFDPSDEKYCQWGRLSKIEDIDTYEYPELIQGYKSLYETLDLDVEHVDMERGEHYDFELSPDQIETLNGLLSDLTGDPVTGITLAREDRPPGYWYNDNYYVNNWGDLTIRINIEREAATTAYTLVVFMDPRSPKEYTHLEKYHAPTKRYETKLQSEAAHLLATSTRDDLEESLGLNEIDDTEYDALVQLVNAIQAVAATEK